MPRPRMLSRLRLSWSDKSPKNWEKEALYTPDSCPLLPLSGIDPRCFEKSLRAHPVKRAFLPCRGLPAGPPFLVLPSLPAETLPRLPPWKSLAISHSVDLAL